MITTIDGVRKYIGGKVWIIGYDSAKRQYVPKISSFVQFQAEEEATPQWHDRKLCEEQCDLLNKTVK